MNKETSTEKLKELEFRISSLEKERKFDIEQLVKEKVEPLLEQAKQVRLNIDNLIYNKYKDILSELHKEKNQIKTIVDNFKIEDAGDLWYAKGTIVSLWKMPSGWSSAKKYEKTTLKGIVDIYDGTQELPSIPTWRLPKKGDVIVRHLKKDGTIGLKLDRMSENGILNTSRYQWHAEEDTPYNNFEMKKKQNGN